MSALAQIPPPPPTLPPLTTTYDGNDEEWEIVQVRRLRPGDIIVPINSRGPLARVVSIHHDTKDFEVEIIDGEKAIDLPFKRDVDRIQPLAGWVSRRVRTNHNDAA